MSGPTISSTAVTTDNISLACVYKRSTSQYTSVTADLIYILQWKQSGDKANTENDICFGQN